MISKKKGVRYDLRLRQPEIPDKLWKDNRIKFEGKVIFGYILAKGYDRLVTDLNVGEIQQTIPITNVGLLKNLEKLERYKYLTFKEYSKGMYTITLNWEV